MREMRLVKADLVASFYSFFADLLNSHRSMISSSIPRTQQQLAPAGRSTQG